METRSFSKMHGLGNDFVVFDATSCPLDLTERQARHIAERREGIGCDQILLVEPSPAEGIDFGYRILNADGSESGQCGNGARCLALFIREQGLSEADTLRVRTCTGDMVLQHLDDGQIRVDMGAPRFDPADVPFQASNRRDSYHLILEDDEQVRFGAVSMGNPHAVLTVPDVTHADLERLGPAIQASAEFPEGVNVGFMQVISRSSIALRVFERGAGETRACGSGACAAVAVGVDQGLLDESVEVSLPGGILRIDWGGGDESLFMSGPAATVFSGNIEI